MRSPDRGFQQAEVGGGEGVGFAHGTQGYVFGGPGADAGQRAEALHQGLGAVRQVQAQLSRGDRRGEALQRLYPLAGHADAVEVGLRQRGGRREQVADAVVAEIFQRLAEALDQAPGDGHRGLHRDLLADDGAHRLFEGIEGHRQAQSRIGGHQRAEQGIPGEMPGDGGRVAVQVEHPADPCLEFGGQGMGGRAEAQRQDLAFRQRSHLEPGRAAVGPEAAGIVVVTQAFDTGEQAQGEMLVELAPFPG